MYITALDHVNIRTFTRDPHGVLLELDFPRD
jgi:hypothetical protein